MQTVYVLSNTVTDLSYTIVFTRNGVEWNTEKREVSSVAIQQWCRPLYGKQSDDYKKVLGTDARGPTHRALL